MADHKDKVKRAKARAEDRQRRGTGPLSPAGSVGPHYDIFGRPRWLRHDDPDSTIPHGKKGKDE